MAGRMHGAAKEAAVEQMKNRMLDAADILVDRQPRIDHAAVGRARFKPRIGESSKIPGRINEGVHGVGFPGGVAATARADDVLPGRMAIEWVAGPIEFHV